MTCSEYDVELCSGSLGSFNIYDLGPTNCKVDQIGAVGSEPRSKDGAGAGSHFGPSRAVGPRSRPSVTPYLQYSRITGDSSGNSSGDDQQFSGSDNSDRNGTQLVAYTATPK